MRGMLPVFAIGSLIALLVFLFTQKGKATPRAKVTASVGNKAKGEAPKAKVSASVGAHAAPAVSEQAIIDLITYKISSAGYPLQFAKMWVCVSAHESDDWKSELFKRAHNPVGMKIPSERQSLRNGSYTIGKQVYSMYPDLRTGIEDLVLYLKSQNYPVALAVNPDALAYFMKQKGFYSDTLENYSAALQRKWNKFFANR